MSADCQNHNKNSYPQGSGRELEEKALGWHRHHRSGVEVGAVVEGVVHIGNVVNTSSFDEQHKKTFGIGVRQIPVYSHRQADSLEAFFDLRAETLMEYSRWKPLFLLLSNLHMNLVGLEQEDSLLD
jgi:hypothetical protein